MMFELKVASKAGFCFGVTRAVGMAYDLIEDGCSACTLGPIIHNPHVVNELAERGVRIINSPTEAKEGEVIILRSHGVTKETMEEIEELGLPYANAVCPFVTKILEIVDRETLAENTHLLITGDEKHPEVQAIASYSHAPVTIVASEEELESFILSLSKKQDTDSIIMVSQTTFPVETFKKYKNIVLKLCTKVLIFDTICSATEVRQNEAVQLARSCDIMIIVGGRSSSNTAKLYDVCSKYSRSFLVESADELTSIDFTGVRKVGLTAGASTPARIIKEVKEKMSEFLEDIDGDDISFEEGLEQTLKSVHSGDKVVGVVTAVAPTEVQVEIGTKHAGYIPLDELTADPTKTPADLVKVGDEIELIVSRVNDMEGTVLLSKRRLDAQAGFEAVCDAYESGEPVKGTVTEVVRGGVIALTDQGTKVFIPASQATARRGDPLEDLLKQPVEFKIIEVNRGRRRAVGSIRALTKDQRKEIQDKFWETIEIGQTYEGEVKSLTPYGAFVDLGGVDGMIHVSELSWNRIKHPSEIVNEGDVVKVYIKDLDPEKRKISLGYKKTEDNPWEILRRDYSIGDDVQATVVSMTPFGAFANIIPGIDGLIHISQISNEHVEKPEDVLSLGENVQVAITDIDFDRKRVSLSIRALQNKGTEEKTQKTPVEEADEEDVVYEVGPDGATEYSDVDSTEE